MRSCVRSVVPAFFVLFPLVVYAQDRSAVRQVAYAPATSAMPLAFDGGPLVLSAPPRESAALGEERFGPVAEYLGKVLGRKVVYRNPGTWGVYQGAMQRGEYDLVFDGPHFNGWRVQKLQHNVLVKLPGEFTYVGVVRASNTKVHGLADLAGRRVCAHAPPNLGTLIMFDEFKNPSRQPVIQTVDGYGQIYRALLEGKCDAAMLPLGHVKKHDPNGKLTRIVFEKRALPEQALSASPRVRPEEQAKIIEALLVPEATPALAKFAEAYGLGRGFMRASNGEYVGVASYLKDMWGYY